MSNSTKKYYHVSGVFLFVSFFILISCRNNKADYIAYYNSVNSIDSTYRIKNDTLTAIKKFKKLFRKYEPRNDERMEEYENYIEFSDKYNKNFGGKKSLYKLIPLVAPYWKFKREDTDFFKLYKKYGIDSITVEHKVVEWKKSLNKQLIDSFRVAFIRDQAKDPATGQQSFNNFRKNSALLKWTLANYGYPSMQKIGLETDDGVFMPMLIYLNHMAQIEDYEYFKTKLIDYVKSGDLPPRDYVEMVERHVQINHLKPVYGVKSTDEEIMKDSANINRNRRLIGLQSFKVRRKITKEFLKNNSSKK
ncbi:hypothetical protein J2810_004616 [Chryseobacterium rhizosphaerae]|uniref:hypothetical protein n=1 Tax=Chryseobacterium rhizosphaerae TaxID=395937 RepID=UPI00285B622A|nr:hypothetical protein [Chryseobacterium rhizosphaerae]MDR6548526.1 hypothetical protein [Chryseobacterium rhizosphaerae]